jgi:hypothetical protein
MMNRKVTGALLLGSALLAGEFWNDKDPAQWSEEEVERLLTKSPWSKQVTAAMDFSKMRGGGPGGPGGGPPGGMGGGMPGGGPPGGGMGGPPPGMGGPGGGMPEFRATVRWESAAPLRAAMKRTLPDMADMHVVSIVGLPMMGARPGVQRGGGDDMAARRQQMLEEMKSSTTLAGKNKKKLSPSRLHVDEASGTLFFFFAPDAEAVAPDAKELVFVTQMGPMEFKAKFSPKEMKYKGEPAL